MKRDTKDMLIVSATAALLLLTWPIWLAIEIATLNRRLK